MKFVLGLTLLYSFSVFAQVKTVQLSPVTTGGSVQDAEALKKSEELRKSVIANYEVRIAKIKADAGGKPLSDAQKYEISMIENAIKSAKDWVPTSMVGTAGGYGPGIQGGYAGGNYVGGMAGGYAGGAVGGYVGGGMNGGYPSNSLWNCQLSSDEKEINCANGKKYNLTIDGDESERSEQYKQKWIPNILEIEKKKSKQE